MAHGVFSNYSSGRLIVSDRQNGLFLFHFDQTIFINPASEEFSLYPNPAEKGKQIIVRSKEDAIAEFSVSIYSENGKSIQTETAKNKTFLSLKTPNTAGIYLVKITYINYLQETITTTKKLVVP
jgi:hypothetical protein